MADELLTCLHCGHQWKPNKRSKGFPKECPKCKSQTWMNYPKIKKYTKDCTQVFVSEQTYESLLRKRSCPKETVASIVDRLLLQDDTISKTVVYENKPKSHAIYIMLEAKEKLLKIKNDNDIKSYDEALWRVRHNVRNRKN